MRFRIGKLCVNGPVQLHIVLFADCSSFFHFFESMRDLQIVSQLFPSHCLLAPHPPGRRCGGLLRRLHRLRSLREQSERRHRAATGGVWGRSGVGGASVGWGWGWGCGGGVVGIGGKELVLGTRVMVVRY